MKALLAPLLFFSAFSLAQVEVREPLVRLLPPGVPNTAAYMELVNTASEEVRLIGAESDLVERIEIHDHQMQNGMMKMVQQNEVVIPANSAVTFRPGGLHLMMFGLKKPIEADQKVTIRLMFADDSDMEINAVVAEPAGSNHHKHH